MIQAIVEQKAFQRGHEYFTESRVRLLEADDTDIAATVRGNSGVYEQTIRLREGSLVTACSCSLIEQPMCRHCVAVLLEYHRWASQRSRRDGPALRESRDRREPKDQHRKASDANGKPTITQEQDVRLSEVIAFVQWAQPAMRSLMHNESLPEAPQMPDGMVAEWVQTICDLHARQRDYEATQQDLHADLAQRDLQLQQLREQLKASQDELGQVRQGNERLQREVTNYEGVLGKLKELSHNIAQFDNEMTTVKGDLSKSQHHLEGLAQSFREVSSVLQDLAQRRET